MKRGSDSDSATQKLTGQFVPKFRNVCEIFSHSVVKLFFSTAFYIFSQQIYLSFFGS